MSGKRADKPQLRFVADYLLSYCTGAVPPPVDIDGHASKRVSREHGFWTYTFGTPGFDELNRVVARLHREFAPRQELSVKTLQESLYGAIYIVADGIRQNASEETAHIDKAVEHVRTVLTAPLREYECWLEVAGLERASLPLTFGETSFSHLRSTKRDPSRLSLHKLRSTLPRATLTNLQQSLGHAFVGTSVGICCTQARDKTAAIEQAEETIRASIECLNFFSDVAEPGRARISLPNERTSATESSRLLAGKDHHMVERSWQLHSPSSLSIEEWQSPGTPLGEAAAFVERLLCKRDPNPVENLLLSAVRWAGRAAATASPQDAFLFSAIALECVTIPSSSDELTYRLSHRVALLLHNCYEERVVVSKELRDLYKVRSKIVHDGDFPASIELRHKMRDIVIRTIIRMLNDSRVRESVRREELDAYFEELALS